MPTRDIPWDSEGEYRYTDTAERHHLMRREPFTCAFCGIPILDGIAVGPSVACGLCADALDVPRDPRPHTRIAELERKLARATHANERNLAARDEAEQRLEWIKQALTREYPK